jgi:hypothetical protein
LEASGRIPRAPGLSHPCFWARLCPGTATPYPSALPEAQSPRRVRGLKCRKACFHDNLSCEHPLQQVVFHYQNDDWWFIEQFFCYNLYGRKRSALSVIGPIPGSLYRSTPLPSEGSALSDRD